MEGNKAISISATDLLAPSTAGSTLAMLAALPAELTDDQWQMLAEINRAPLPALPAISDDAFAEAMKLLETLPRAKRDDRTGELIFRTYSHALRHMPAKQIWWMVDQAIRQCKFFPTVKELIDIAEKWQRRDDAVEVKREASNRFHRERLRRMRQRKPAPPLTQEMVDAMDEPMRLLGLKTGALIEVGGRIVPSPEATGAQV